MSHLAKTRPRSARRDRTGMPLSLIPRCRVSDAGRNHLKPTLWSWGCVVEWQMHRRRIQAVVVKKWNSLPLNSNNSTEAASLAIKISSLEVDLRLCLMRPGQTHL